MATITTTCSYCGKDVTMRKAEYNRRTKKNPDARFFCNGSCSGAFGNRVSGRMRRAIEKTCPVCGNPFVTMTGCKSSTFCSRSCASRGSVTEHRRARASEMGIRNGGLSGVAGAAKLNAAKEAYKYVMLKGYLTAIDEPFSFEHPVGPFVFDLYLPKRMAVVEFDGPEHAYHQELDSKKEAEARAIGLTVHRIPAIPRRPISPEVIFYLIASSADVP